MFVKVCYDSKQMRLNPSFIRHPSSIPPYPTLKSSQNHPARLVGESHNRWFDDRPGDAESLAETFVAGVPAAQLGKCRWLQGDDPMTHRKGHGIHGHLLVGGFKHFLFSIGIILPID